MFKSLCLHCRAICFADGWFKWKKVGDKKQPYFIRRRDGQPIFMFERSDEEEGFLIVTASLIYITGDRLSWYRKLPGSG
ncbi:hypothetical protein EGH44_25305 [Klebsiella aerogenes]|nr:hypothetical protein EGH44_25305 [Klebsiella aerogenes]